MTKKKVNWSKIRTEYITTNTSQRKLAAKYQIPFSTLRDRAKKEEWAELKKSNQEILSTKTVQKVNEKIVEQEVDRITKLLKLSDELTNKVEEAIAQIDTYIVKNKKITREIEYLENKAYAKPAKEIKQEIEDLKVVKGNIDRLGLQQLANTLKSIKDVQFGCISDSDKSADKILENMQTLTEVLSRPVPNRNIEDFE